MNKYELRFLDFISRNVIKIGFVAVSLLGFLVRTAFFNVASADYQVYIGRWIEQLNEYKGLWGLCDNIGEYNVPYMLFLAIAGKTPFNNLYEVKLFSVAFDYIGAFTIIKIISYIDNTKLITLKNLCAYSAYIFSPVVFFNSGFWAQCDSVYSSLLLVCAYFMIKGNYNISMVFFGLAFTMKLQAVFFLPVIFIYYFASKKMNASSMLCIPTVYYISVCPALFAGRGFVDTFSIYIKQVSLYSGLTLGCPNAYVFVQGDSNMFRKMGMIVTITILGIGAVISIYKKMTSPKEVIMISAWVSMVCTYFLPSMHERYAFIACSFSLVLAFVSPKEMIIAVGVNSICLLSYAPLLFNTSEIGAGYLSAVSFILLVLLTKHIFFDDNSENSVNTSKSLLQ